MGYATRSALEVVNTPAPSTSDLDFDDFSARLARDLDPRSTLERVIVDRLTLAAWRLHLESLDETSAALDGDDLAPLSNNALRAERSLETALGLLETVRSLGRPRWGHANHEAEPVNLPSPVADDLADDLDDGPYSNEWPILPEDHVPARPVAEEHEAEADDEPTARWQDRLVFDEEVSDSSPVVKGTWVTVRHVVSLIVDGWTWSDILRTHPELTEDDVRTCLAYTAEQDDAGEY
jgi:uncharacterized protein (DUF433 family)